MENRYNCVLKRGSDQITISLFTERKMEDINLIPLAFTRGVEFMEELGVDAKESEFKIINIDDCGVWPKF